MKNNNWQRILWKEYREGWPVIAAFLVAPVLIFPISRFFPLSALATAAAATVLFAIPFASVLWASEKRRLVKEGRDVMAAVLPLTPFQDWAASFLLPALAVGVCGGWMYMMYEIVPPNLLQQSSPFSGIVITITAFMLSSFLSKNVSHILGITIGTLWILCTFPVSSYMAGFIAKLGYIPIVLAVAALGAFKFRKAAPKRIKAYAVFTLVVLTLSLLGKDGMDVLLFVGTNANIGMSGMRYAEFSTNEGVIQSSTNSKSHSGMISYQVYFAHTPDAQHTFPSSAIPAAADNRGRIYVLSQQPGHSLVSVFRWNTSSGRVQRLCEFTAIRDIGYYSAYWLPNNNNMNNMVSDPQRPGWVDPEGKRLLIRVRSAMGDGMDLWLINLTTGARKLLMANTSFSQFAWDKATWMKDRVFLTGFFPSIEIDTVHFTVKPLLPERKSKI